MAIYNVSVSMDCFEGSGCSLVEALEIAGIYMADFPGVIVASGIELGPRDALTSEGARLMAEDELPGRWVRPGLRVVDGDRDD